ncbi:MAG: MotA/TolQ/ExbB proton channel family protein [Cellvibrionaceae bacterium]|nr:MotA/TolQ/ExbB proton channel family protein [Cellvibrionaceae bacterium]
MFAKPIEALIAGSGASLITDVFIIAMLACFGYAIYARRQDKAPGFVQYTPTLLTSLGILGTFCGIVAGLLGFDIGNIDGSIDKLLMGMKTAFTTSLVGMGLSILFKMLLSSALLTRQQEQQTQPEQAIGIADLYQVMAEQRDGIVQLQNAIAGEHQSSLNGQLQALRAENKQLLAYNHKDNKQRSLLFQTFQKQLWERLDHFTEHFSNTAASQMAKAQQAVIADFNNHFADQFGSNFQRLDQALEHMLQWQENYRSQLEEMRSNYDQGVKAIHEAESALSQVTQQTQLIGQNMESWHQVMEVNQHQIQELERHLGAFAEIKDKAVAAAPEINSHIDNTLKGVQTASERLSQGLLDSGEQLQTRLSEGAEQFKRGGESLTDLFSNTEAALSSGQQALESAYQQSASALNSAAEELAQQQQQGQQLLLDNAKLQREEIEKNQQTLADSHSELNEQFTQLGKDISLESQAFAEQIRESGNALMRSADRSREAFDNDMQVMVEAVTDRLQKIAAQQAEESLKVVQLQIKLTEDLHRILTHAGSTV